MENEYKSTTDTYDDDAIILKDCKNAIDGVFDYLYNNNPRQSWIVPLTIDNVFNFELKHCLQNKRKRLEEINDGMIINIRVYAGGMSGNMIGPFTSAMATTGIQKRGIATVEYKFKKVFYSKSVSSNMYAFLIHHACYY